MCTETKLTKRTVEAIPTPAKGAVAEAWDSELRGFHVRVSATGRRTFRLFYRFGGRQRVATIGELSEALTAEQARARAKALVAEIIAGRDPLAEAEKAAEAAAEERRRAVTVNQLIDVYLDQGPLLDPAKRARSWEHDRSCLDAHVRPTLGKLLAGNVRRGDVEGMVAAIARGKTARVEKLGPRAKRIVRGGPAAARAALVALSTVYSWSEKRDLIVGNPCKGVKKPPAGKKERYLSDAEGARLLDTIAAMETAGDLHPVFGDTLRLLALTGARRSEIERLEWSEIDFERGVAFLPAHRSKTGRKTIPLSAPALAILARREQSGQYVFPSPLGDDKPANALSKNWLRVRAAADLPDVRVHDLRHTMASLLVANGASLPMIGRVLGHTSAATTSRYAHLQADPLRALVDAAGARLTAGTRKPGDEEGASVLRLSGEAD
ncbi:MAG: site-specific integrase [Hyphomonadaceae bacterium]|nr:site-specific integrase [Hyphomonadaceae bacterium]